eukprot:COSAG01_NODE_128_length_24936_cov_324.347264_11_plen_390_part_00
MTDLLPGVFMNGVHCGIKKSALDLALLYVPEATGSAGVFTQHHFAASSVHLTRERVSNLKAIVINSGNANACTGDEGRVHSEAMTQSMAQSLGLDVAQVGVASTGVIGKTLDLAAIEQGIAVLGDCPFKQDYTAAAGAILTTDTCEKSAFKEAEIAKTQVKAYGMTKGSGMIAPNMATTLAFVVLNIDANSPQLQAMLDLAAERSYNRISVDADTSTNDMLLAFASGEKTFDWDNKAAVSQLQDLLDDVCIDLAKQVVLDGEGATKLIEVCVEQARYEQEAALLAKQVVDSPLVKTAIHGQDPNWGRFLMAIGKNLDLKIDVDQLELYLGDILLFSKGQQVVYQEEEMHMILKQKHIKLRYVLYMGYAKATVWGCDLSARYVEINTAYT